MGPDEPSPRLALVMAWAQRPEVIRSWSPYQVRIVLAVVDGGPGRVAPLVLTSPAIAATNLVQKRLRGEAPDDTGLTSVTVQEGIVESGLIGILASRMFASVAD
jgi:hypothetical protein